MGEILINQLFAGSYLSEGENIGHEIINLFQDDDGNNYLFITKNGIVKNHDVESVVFVQNIKARETMEVIMKAVGLTPVNKDEITISDGKILYVGSFDDYPPNSSRLSYLLEHYGYYDPDADPSMNYADKE